ncbi:uncharacterized protein LOC112094822 [Morus notabilis]|uniref:uncharacterized protein LOC112094822 n=1 Tax=Morus notabilis TaxID=981085 RepID=UPI000CED0994|nr:uncharacterized protein LOC112094822 [Morus notabilis]
MTLSVFRSILERIATRPLVLLHAAAWTVLLTLTVAVASFSAEIAFVTAISPSFSKSCNAKGFVRIPLNDPMEVLCFPAHMVRRSKLDFFVPTVFAALVVAGSACVVRSFALADNRG